MLYLVEELQIDAMENEYSRAVSWGFTGVTLAPRSARFKETVIGTGWPIERGKAYARYRLTNAFTGNRYGEVHGNSVD